MVHFLVVNKWIKSSLMSVVVLISSGWAECVVKWRSLPEINQKNHVCLNGRRNMLKADWQFFFVHRLGRKRVNNGVSLQWMKSLMTLNLLLLCNDLATPFLFLLWYSFSSALVCFAGELCLFRSLFLIPYSLGGGASWPLTKGLWTWFPPKPTWVTFIGEGGYSWADSRYYFCKSRLLLQML